MVRLLRGPTLILALTFAAALSLIRAQPFKDDDLRAALMPAGCAQPCFIGLQPGRTTLIEAIDLLRRHVWVTNIQNEYSITGYRVITWEWSGSQPDWIDASHPAMIGFLDSDPDSRIVALEAVIRLPLGRLWLLYGEPDTTHWELTSLHHPKAINHRVVYYYAGGRFAASTVLRCPLRPDAYWNAAPLRLMLGQYIEGGYAVSLGNLVRRCR